MKKTWIFLFFIVMTITIWWFRPQQPSSATDAFNHAANPLPATTDRKTTENEQQLAQSSVKIPINMNINSQNSHDQLIQTLKQLYATPSQTQQLQTDDVQHLLLMIEQETIAQRLLWSEAQEHLRWLADQLPQAQTQIAQTQARLEPIKPQTTREADPRQAQLKQAQQQIIAEVMAQYPTASSERDQLLARRLEALQQQIYATP